MSTASPMPSFKDIPLWQRSMQLTVNIYQFTSQLPAAERLGLGNNLQQTATSVPSVLAVGTRAGRDGFRIACVKGLQALAEVETLLIIAQQMYPAVPTDDILAETSELQTYMVDMVKRLTKQPPKPV